MFTPSEFFVPAQNLFWDTVAQKQFVPQSWAFSICLSTPLMIFYQSFLAYVQGGVGDREIGFSSPTQPRIPTCKRTHAHTHKFTYTHAPVRTHTICTHTHTCTQAPLSTQNAFPHSNTHTHTNHRRRVAMDRNLHAPGSDVEGLPASDGEGNVCPPPRPWPGCHLRLITQ